MTQTALPKSCSTCEHREGRAHSQFARCGRTGSFASTERMFPTAVSSGCGAAFEGWAPRIGFKQRLIYWWSGFSSTKTGDPK